MTDSDSSKDFKDIVSAVLTSDGCQRSVGQERGQKYRRISEGFRDLGGGATYLDFGPAFRFGNFVLLALLTT